MAEATRPADLIVVDQLDLFRGDRVPKHFIDKILGEARGRGAASPVVRAIPARKQTARMPSVKTDRLRLAPTYTRSWLGSTCACSPGSFSKQHCR